MDGPFPPYRVHAPTRFERTNPCCEVSGAATISAFAGEFTSFHPGNTGSTFAVFDPASGIYEPLSTFDPLVNQGFDSGLKAPSTDQFSIGIEHEIARQSVVELTYVRKDARNSTGWQDITGVYGIDTAELPDGRTLTVFPLLTDPSESFFQLTNPSDFYLSYDGFVVALDRRWFRSWQGRISYSLSRASGLQASSIARPARTKKAQEASPRAAAIRMTSSTPKASSQTTGHICFVSRALAKSRGWGSWWAPASNTSPEHPGRRQEPYDYPRARARCSSNRGVRDACPRRRSWISVFGRSSASKGIKELSSCRRLERLQRDGHGACPCGSSA